MEMRRYLFVLLLVIPFNLAESVEFRGSIVDVDNGRAIAARVYLLDETGRELFVETADQKGSAIKYREQWVPMPGISEKHTTVSRHRFRADLKPGTYQLIVEKGKEYFSKAIEFTIMDEPVTLDIGLKRWVNMSERGWFCGETHIHRRFEELPILMQAEGLNVAFPVSYWTTTSIAPPSLNPPILQRAHPSALGPRQDHGADPVWVDRQHVILPRNTEYEIFEIGNKRHTQGAIFLLNHKTVFTKLAPPISEIARQAHEEGALLDLDKHSWPWSMMLVPVANIDLFELSNNHVWKTKFGFKTQQVMPPEWMDVEMESPGKMTEWGWLNYGWEVYYSLLNCGFRISPTAGTASGVHPVPLGYSRVYVNAGKDLTLDAFLDGLKSGRSFVTTGPMLFATVNQKQAGETFRVDRQQETVFTVTVESLNAQKVSAVEFLVNGEVVKSVIPKQAKTQDGAWQTQIEAKLTLEDSGWIAVRSIELQPDGRKRFAHTAPWYVEMAGRPRTPRPEQIEYFISLMKREIERNRNVLSSEALAEFEQALEVYQQIEMRVK